MKTRKLSTWRKEGLPKRAQCYYFGFSTIPEGMKICEECDSDIKKLCAEWSHFWDFFPMYLEAETEPCGVDQYGKL